MSPEILKAVAGMKTVWLLGKVIDVWADGANKAAEGTIGKMFRSKDEILQT